MLDKFKQRLKSQGFKLTPPRLAVYHYLQQHDSAAMRDVIAGLQGSHDQASVYRAVALFKQLGIVQDIIISGRRLIELTDSFDSHHHHLTCQNCGRSVSVEDPELERRLHALATAHGITPITHQIEVSGLCFSCAAKS